MGPRERAQTHRELPGAVERQVRDDEALVAPLAHPDERRVELIGYLAQDVAQVLEGSLLRASGRGVKQLLTQLGLERGELVGALGPERSEGARELDGEIVGDRVEQSGVLLGQRVQPPPPHLDNRDDVAAKPHGHHHEAREGRQHGGSHAKHLMGLLIHDVSRREASLTQRVRVRRHHAKTHGPAVTHRNALDAASERHEACRPVVQDRARDAAQPEAVRLGEVDEGAVRLHGLRDLLEHAAKERL